MGGLGAISAAVIVISVFSPKQRFGQRQDHVPIAAVLTWVWGVIASRSMVIALAAQRERPERLGEVRLLVVGIAALWFGAAVAAVFGPEIVIGADPTRLPVSALLAPIAAMLLTTTACQLFSSLAGKGDVPGRPVAPGR